MALGDPAELRQRIRRQRGDRNAGVFSGGPKPVEGAVVQPLPCGITEEPVPQTEHSRLLSPVCDACARFRAIERHRTHDREPAGVVPDRLERHVVRIRVPTRRMNDGGIDAPFVHQSDGLLRGEGRHLPMREVAWQAGAPEVNLGVDYLHRMLPTAVAALMQPRQACVLGVPRGPRP